MSTFDKRFIGLRRSFDGMKPSRWTDTDIQAQVDDAVAKIQKNPLDEDMLMNFGMDAFLKSKKITERDTELRRQAVQDNFPPELRLALINNSVEVNKYSHTELDLYIKAGKNLLKYYRQEHLLKTDIKIRKLEEADVVEGMLEPFRDKLEALQMQVSSFEGLLEGLKDERDIRDEALKSVKRIQRDLRKQIAAGAKDRVNVIWTQGDSRYPSLHKSSDFGAN